MADANLKVLDGDGAAKYLKEAGAGSDVDPHIPSVNVANAPVVTNAMLGAATSDAAVITDATGTIHQYLRGLVKLIAAKIGIGTVDTVTAVTTVATVTTVTNPVPTKGNGLSVTATLTVTNGAYTAQDVVGGLITFANAVSAVGKECILNSLVLAGLPSAIPLELWWLNANLATPCADNAAFATVAADQAKELGIVDMDAAGYKQAGAAGTYTWSRGGLGMQLKANAATTSLYAYLKHTTTTSPGVTTLYLTAQFEYIS
ncbi:MAG: hypothetical protein V2A79_19855 [Planctomycetota bacterium]